MTYEIKQVVLFCNQFSQEKHVIIGFPPHFSETRLTLKFEENQK